MANLADLQGNTQNRQRRVTTNRDSIIPAARPDQPALEVNAPIVAPRGPAEGARQLAAILGTAEQAGMSFADAAKVAREKRNNEDTAAGMRDAAAGVVDESRQAASKAYRNAVSLTDARTALARTTADIETQLDGWVNEGKDGNGDGKFDLTDVSALIDQHYRAVALDGDGKPRDFGSDKANIAFSQELAAARPQFMEYAAKAIAQREHTELVNNQAALMVTDFHRPGADGKFATTYDVDRYIAALPPQIDKTKAKQVFIQAAVNDASETGNYKALDALANTRRGDGAAAFTPAEVAVIRSQRDAVQSQAERDAEIAQKQRYENTTMGFLGRMVQGQSVAKAEIVYAMQKGDLPANTAFELVNKIETEQREARAEARAAAADAREASNTQAELGMVGLTQLWRTGGGPTDPGDALAEATRLMRNGRLGSGLNAIRNMQQLITAAGQGRSTIESRPDVHQFGVAVDKHFAAPKAKSSIAARLGVGQDADPAVIARHAAAMTLYNHLTLDQQVPGAQAYQEVLQKYDRGTARTVAPGPVLNRGMSGADAARLRELEAKRGR